VTRAANDIGALDTGAGVAATADEEADGASGWDDPADATWAAVDT
jgi:hypothetical protein